MSVAVIIDLPNGNQERYDQIGATIFPDGTLRKGWQVHIAGRSRAVGGP